jgi:hypothetical protein
MQILIFIFCHFKIYFYAMDPCTPGAKLSAFPGLHDKHFGLHGLVGSEVHNGVQLAAHGGVWDRVSFAWVAEIKR